MSANLVNTAFPGMLLDDRFSGFIEPGDIEERFKLTATFNADSTGADFNPDTPLDFDFIASLADDNHPDIDKFQRLVQIAKTGMLVPMSKLAKAGQMLALSAVDIDYGEREKEETDSVVYGRNLAQLAIASNAALLHASSRLPQQPAHVTFDSLETNSKVAGNRAWTNPLLAQVVIPKHENTAFSIEHIQIGSGASYDKEGRLVGLLRGLRLGYMEDADGTIELEQSVYDVDVYLELIQLSYTIAGTKVHSYMANRDIPTRFAAPLIYGIK